MTADAAPVLWHIKVSNYNEKARWALDHKRVSHRRRDPMPGAHMAIALALTRRVATFPVLQLDGTAIGDSTRIIATLEQRFPDPPLYPADAAQRRRTLELEEFFDENLGHDVRRVAFWELLREPDLMRSRAAEITTPRQGRVLATALPAFAAMVRRRYTITERSAAQSLLKVRAAMRLIRGPPRRPRSPRRARVHGRAPHRRGAARAAPGAARLSLPRRERLVSAAPAGDRLRVARAGGRRVGAADLRAPPAAVV
jgi:glutathione S-transferase